MKKLEKALSVALEMILLLVILLLVLAPFHGRATEHFTVTQTHSETLVEIAGETSSLERGERVDIYRFNHQWKAPIGSGTVESIAAGTATIRIDPRDMTWPIGRHSTITRTDERAYISLGTADGLSEGMAMQILQGRESIGYVAILNLEEHRAEIALPATLVDDDTPLVASEFTYATQVTTFDNHLLANIELAGIVLVLIAYSAIYLRMRRSPLLLLGEQLRRVPLSRHAIFWMVNIVVGVPFAWFMTKMPLYLGAYLASYISQNFFGTYLYLYDDLTRMLPYAYAILGTLYYGYLAYTRRSPLLDFWRAISYKGESGVTTVSFQRGLFLWALHLVIVYAFAATLLNFLQGDIRAAMAIGFPAPTIEAWFEQAKFIIWGLTVVGVLVGYGYSVVSIFWAKYIRNLDFTIIGWLTNGFCYPFLGVVIWQMTPAFTGIDPIITAGPLLYLMLVLGFVLNFLYMLSIFNLGRLFDLMTDKGVRTSGFYAVIRHPNYTLEAMMFVVTELVGLTMGVHWLGISMYVFLYWIRSEREDNFMQWSNPDYRVYQKATPWKFIPGIY